MVPLPPTPSVGRYVVDAELGRGGMGVVYRAHERASGRTVALKRLKPELVGDESLRALFEGEYRCLVQLQHPRILQVYDYGLDKVGPYFAMELLDGKDLGEFAPLPLEDACRHLRDVASSLALLHARRFVYRDLNPRNVRLTKDHRAKLIDFGAVVPFGITDHIVGTASNVAPEAFHGEPLDAATDLYALGAVFYTALTGRAPYAVRSLDDLPEVFRGPMCEPPSTYSKAIPLALDDLVLALLSRDRLARPTSAAEVIERLNAIAGLESEAHAAVAQAYLATPQLVFRDHELGQLRRIVARAIEGHAASAFIEGETGSGRTRLVEELAIEAQLGGATVLRASAGSDKGPFGVMRRLGWDLLVAEPEVARRAAATHPELAALFPGARENAPATVKAVSDVGEQHARVKEALLRWFLEVATLRPLAILVDDIDTVDDDSSVVLGKLGAEAEAQKLALVVTRQPTNELPANTKAGRKGRCVRLRSLTAKATAELTQAVFGPVENARQLGYRLHDRTEGNPRQCLELIRQLIAERTVTYENGKWHVPAELRDTSLPVGMYELYARRFSTLSERARALAGVLSVEARTLSLESCAALSGTDAELVAPVLEELVSAGVLLPEREDYRFSHGAFRAFLYERLAPSEREAAHLRAARYLCELREKDTLSDVDAGWHLIHGGEATRGAELLVRASYSLWTTREGLRHAAPGLEAALEIFDRTNQPEHAKYAALNPLMLAGWYIDRRYVVAHGSRALEVILRMTGFEEGNRLAHTLGPQAALMAGLSLATSNHQKNRHAYLVPKGESETLDALFAALVAVYSMQVGTAATCADVKVLDECLRTGALMPVFGKDHILGIFYDYARFYAAITRGRFTEAEPIGQRIYEWLHTPAALEAMGQAVFVSRAPPHPKGQAHDLRHYPLLVPDADGWQVAGVLTLAYTSPPHAIAQDVRDAVAILVHGWSRDERRELAVARAVSERA